jgi:hypothetical protein
MKKTAAAQFFIGLLLPAGILILYYSIHKPITVDHTVGLLTMLYRFLIAALMVGLGGGIGLRTVKLENLYPLTRISLQAGLGLGFLGTGYFLIGVTLGLPFWLSWLLFVGLWVLFHKHIIQWVRQWKGLQELWLESGNFSHTIALLIGLMQLFTLTIALAPPLKYDSLVYHLTLPEAYLNAGQVQYFP